MLQKIRLVLEVLKRRFFPKKSEKPATSGPSKRGVVEIPDLSQIDFSQYFDEKMIKAYPPEFLYAILRTGDTHHAHVGNLGPGGFTLRDIDETKKDQE